MAITQQFNLNMIPQTVPVVVPVNQYDTGTGRLIIKLYLGANTYSPSSATVKIQGTKPDKKGFQYDATISGNTVTADLKQQMTACYGDVRCQVVVTESTGKTGTFVFILRVQQSALEDDTDTSDTDLPDIIDAAESYAERAEDAADSAEEWAYAAVEVVGYYPYIDSTTHHWMVYDIYNSQWVDTGINATGDVDISVSNSCLYFDFHDSDSSSNNNS